MSNNIFLLSMNDIPRERTQCSRFQSLYYNQPPLSFGFSFLVLRAKFLRSIYSMLFLTKELIQFVVRCCFCNILFRLMVYHLKVNPQRLIFNWCILESLHKYHKIISLYNFACIFKRFMNLRILRNKPFRMIQK